jgi:hypothetical protein
LDELHSGSFGINGGPLLIITIAEDLDAFAPAFLADDRFTSVTNEASGSIPKWGSFSAATEVQWPHFRQPMAIRLGTPDR